MKVVDVNNMPRGLATDSEGRLLVANGREVTVFDSSLKKIKSITSQDIPGS